jgi:hypothetical protein
VRAAVPAEQVQECLRVFGRRSGMRLRISLATLARDRVALRVFLHFVGAHE